MGFWIFLEYIAWSLSAAMLIWMLVDAFMVSSMYDEDYLMSSREGDDMDIVHGVNLDEEAM